MAIVGAIRIKGLTVKKIMSRDAISVDLEKIHPIRRLMKAIVRFATLVKYKYSTKDKQWNFTKEDQ